MSCNTTFGNIVHIPSSNLYFKRFSTLAKYSSMQ